MPHPEEAALVASLPPQIRKPMQAALKHAPKTIADGLLNAPKAHDSIKYPVAEILRDAGFEEHDPLPDAKDLTPVQRAIVEIFAHRETFTAFLSPLPMWAAGRRRYLGEGTRGVLERMVDGKRGEPKKLPLWRALALRGKRSLLPMKLPLLERLEVLWNVACDDYELRSALGQSIEWGTITEIKGQADVARFAAACLTEMAKSRIVHPGGRDDQYVAARAVFVIHAAQPLFHAIHTAKMPIEPEWDVLLPEPEFPDGKRYLALIASLPPERRGPAAVATIGKRSDRLIHIGLALLEAFPTREVMKLVLDNIDQSDHHPKREVLAALTKLAAKHPLVDEMLAAFTGRKPLRQQLTLKVKAKRKPRTFDDLSAIERKQLAHAGKLWDGKKLDARKRMSTDKKDGEVSLRSLLEIKDLGAYTLLRYAGDTGCVFKAGTTKVVAEIVQDSLECDDPALHEALQLVV